MKIIWSLMLTLLCLLSARSAPETRPEKTVVRRVADRSFPSVFQAWNPADNLKEDKLATEARHDLIFHGENLFGLRWDNAYPGLATNFTAASILQAGKRRRDLLSRNPNLVLLMEIRYRDAHRSFLPDGHQWWRRDGQGRIVSGWEEGNYLQMDFSHPAYQEQVAAQAQAAVQSGIVDGIMLDWWDDAAERLALVKTIRDRIGPEALILANANDRKTTNTAPFINGYFMECYRSRTAADWKRIAETLAWAEKNLRAPRINCLETWYHTSRNDVHLMRATTTLSLVLSDGYCLFSDPNPLPTADHLHNWYPFWQRQLGSALGTGKVRPDGAITREFSGGVAAYNPMGNQPVTITFPEARWSRATGKQARTHLLNPCDGDLFLKQDVAEETAGGTGKPGPQP
jgi:hypothetical protein